MKNKLAFGIVVLLIGIALLITGMFHNGTAKCNNETMSPGDMCIIGSTIVSYQARRDDDLKTGRTQLALGGAFVLAGGVLTVLGVRDRRRAAPMPPPTAA